MSSRVVLDSLSCEELRRDEPFRLASTLLLTRAIFFVRFMLYLAYSICEWVSLCSFINCLLFTPTGIIVRIQHDARAKCRGMEISYEKRRTMNNLQSLFCLQRQDLNDRIGRQLCTRQIYFFVCSVCTPHSCWSSLNWTDSVLIIGPLTAKTWMLFLFEFC